MRTTNGMVFALAAGALLAGLAGAEVTAVSDAAALDTRSLSAVAAVEDEGMDTRGFTEDWSGPVKLNTKMRSGTMVLVR